MLRPAEEVLRRGLLQNLPLIHKPDGIRHFTGKIHLVRHAHHCHPLLRQTALHIQHLPHHLRIQRRGRLIKQHHRQLHGQRAGNRHALLLAARKLRRISTGFMR